MTHKVGPKGQVVLPKPMRDRLGIQPGDEVLFDEADGGIVVRKARSKADIVGSLRGILAGPGRSLTDELMQEKQREREREQLKLGRIA